MKKIYVSKAFDLAQKAWKKAGGRKGTGGKICLDCKKHGRLVDGKPIVWPPQYERCPVCPNKLSTSGGC